MKCFCTRSKTYHCKVVLLDEQELLQEIQDNSIGQLVLDTVFRHLNLIETAYFGLRYIDPNNQTHWLDTTKKVAKQLKGKDSFTLYFGVKFYAVDPCKLVEEITRYQFFLQVKQDILQGRLPVSFDLASELGAYAVQSELGDYDPRRHSPGYVSEFRFVSNQTVELENKIAELHKDLQGQLPAVAELNYLDKVKWLEMYAVDLHPVIGEDNVEYFLGLTPTGVIVLRNKNKVANYYWPRISKIYFKGKYFMLRVCDKSNEENTYGFETPSRPACKHLHKCCVEHHSFFRLVHVTPNPPDVVSTRFSSTRSEKLSGRSSQISMRNPPTFTRTPSRRYQRRLSEADQDTNSKHDQNTPAKENLSESVRNVSAIQPVNPYYQNRSDSPRSTRSAPWGAWGNNGPPRSTYSSHSPRSVRSAGPGPPLRLSHARRSSSVESQSSNESRPCRRHKHRNRRGSDNESDLSRCSSHGHRRHGRKSRRSSGSEYDRHSGNYSNSRYQLIESEVQWREVQRQQAEGSTGIHHANVVRPRSGYINSGIETESELSSCHHHRRKHKKHRSRSRSPSDNGKSRLPEELKKHLEFQLVDTEGMSEDQLREIPYTIVTTNASKAVRVRLSPSGRPKSHHSSRRTKSSSLKDGVPGSNTDSPPPPYSESPVLSDLTNTSTSTAAGPATSSNSKHIAQLPRLSSQMIRTTAQYGNNSKSAPCSSNFCGNSTSLLVHHSSSNLLQQSSTTSHSRDGSVDSNSWLGETPDLPNSPLVTGLPPQPHCRRSNNNLHSDMPLNSSRSFSNPKIWSTPEIRGAVGLPWSSITEQLQTPQSNNVYSTLDSPRRTSNLNIEQNNTNQNILEHRSINGSIFRSGSKNIPSNNLGQNRFTYEIEKSRKNATLVESGILGRHSHTPNGTVAWPNEKQLGWQPKFNGKNVASVPISYQWENNLEWEKKNGGAESTAITDNSSNLYPAWQTSYSSLKSPEKGPLIYSPHPQISNMKEKKTMISQDRKLCYQSMNGNKIENQVNNPKMSTVAKINEKSDNNGVLKNSSNMVDRIIQEVSTEL